MGAGINIYTIGAAFVLNTNIGSSVVDAAATVLEELGHAYNFATGAGGSSIVLDGLADRGNVYADSMTGKPVGPHQYNDSLIPANCYK